LREVEAKHPEVANLFRLFESRIDAVVQVISQQDMSAQESPNVVVSMSGSGLAFDWSKAFYEGNFHCALEFTDIAETDREVLLQHVHNLQLESLRSRNDADF